MKYFVYILLCDQGVYYVGSTDNLKRRMAEHRAGKSLYTKQFATIERMHTEEYPSRAEAEARERQIKG